MGRNHAWLVRERPRNFRLVRTDEHPAPLLFVHGGSLAAWCWDEHFLDFFADKGFRAVAVSLRGHGASTLSQPLNSCSVADYVDDVRATVDMLGAESVLIGRSMGCFVVQKYLEKHPAPAVVLMAPSTPQGVRRITLRLVRRHPWIMLRANTFGSSADLFNTPALAREYLFCAHTPEPTSSRRVMSWSTIPIVRGQGTARTLLDHRVSQRNVTLKTGGFSAGAVPFTEIAVAILVAARFGKHRVQPQQGKLVVHEPRLGRRCR